MVPASQRQSTCIAGRDLLQSQISTRFIVVTGQADALQVAILITAILRHGNDVVDLLC